MKTILIIILLHSTASVTVVEFDDAQACKSAEKAIQKLASVQTACVPKASP